MNLGEITNWLHSARCVESLSEYDECSNEWRTVIYEKDGQFFRVEFCNGHICSELGNRGVYKLTPVKKASWMEYRYEWVNV